MAFAGLLLSLAAVDLIAAMTPGPNFVLVAHSAANRSRAYALLVVAGLVVSNLVWCLAVVLGFASLFRAVPWLYAVVRLAGGAYLVFLGVQMWRASAMTVARSDPRTGTAQAAFIRGMFTNLGNPKSLIYFGSVFAVFMAPGTPVWVQFVAVAIVLANTVVWYGAVAWSFSYARIRNAYRSAQRPFNRIGGLLVGAFGARLILADD